MILGRVFPRRVEARRARRMRASREDVLPLVTSFKTGWVKWSPFGPERDPSLVLTYEGPDAGVGATQRWTAKRMKSGYMAITRADPDRVAYEIEILGGAFRGDGVLALEAADGGCEVTWTSTIDLGRKRILGPIVRRGMGSAFDEGLAALERAALKDRA
jgi:hypothetical protein